MNLVVTAIAMYLLYASISAFDRDFGLDSLNDSHPNVVHTYISIIGAGTGVIIALLSLIGFCGAVKKSRAALTLYAAIIFMMVVFLIMMVTLTFQMSDQQSGLKELDKGTVNATITMYDFTNPNDIKTKGWDRLQKQLKCCGVNSPSDWSEYSLHKIPPTCCKEPTESSLPVFQYCVESDFKVGCYKTIIDLFYANIDKFRIMLCILIVFGISCIVGALCMVRTLKRSLEVV